MMKKAFLFAAALLAVGTLSAVNPASFEEKTLDAESVWTADENFIVGENTWISGDFSFSTMVEDWGEYGMGYMRMSVSNITATEYTDYFYYNAAAGKAAEGSNYGVWNQDMFNPGDKIQLTSDEAQTISGMAVTNTAAVINAILHGDGMTPGAFGEGDWFMLTITGYNNEEVTGTVNFYLADFRNENNDYIGSYVENWQWIDLTTLGKVTHFTMALSSTKSNSYGMTTPAYVCIDNIGGSAEDCQLGDLTTTKIARPASFEEKTLNVSSVWTADDDFVVGENNWTSGDFTFSTMVADWGEYGKGYMRMSVSNITATEYTDYFYYNAAAGKAAHGNNYGVWNQDMYNDGDKIAVTSGEAQTVSGMAVTNNAAVINAILNGDGMTPGAFGEGDWFLLTITGYNNEEETGTVNFYLADFRNENEDGIGTYAENWQWIDLTSLGDITHFTMALTSTKGNDYGMTTPAYVCIDNIGGKAENCQLGEMTTMEIPTALHETESHTNRANKLMLNGQIYILRNGIRYNLIGNVVE